MTSLYFTKLFVIILQYNIWHLYLLLQSYSSLSCTETFDIFYLLQSYSSSSYTITFDIFIFYKAIRHQSTLKHLTSLSFTKLFVTILHWNIWNLYLLQSCSSSSYTKTFDIFIFNKAIRHHPTLKHLTSLSFKKLFVIILHLNIWHLYLLKIYSSSSYTKTFDIFIFYKAIRHHPTL